MLSHSKFVKAMWLAHHFVAQAIPYLLRIMWHPILLLLSLPLFESHNVDYHLLLIARTCYQLLLLILHLNWISIDIPCPSIYEQHLHGSRLCRIFLRETIVQFGCLCRSRAPEMRLHSPVADTIRQPGVVEHI